MLDLFAWNTMKLRQYPPVPERNSISSTDQKINAVVSTRDYLFRLTSTKETPRIPLEVRREARTLLRHYPLPAEMKSVMKNFYDKEKTTQG